jgi:hypothetical protein
MIALFLISAGFNFRGASCLFGFSPSLVSISASTYKRPSLAIYSSSINSPVLWETGSNDSTWLLDANSIEYVVGGDGETLGTSSAFSFQGLGKLGLNISTMTSSRNIIPYHLVGGNDLFCNRELNMDQIEAIGDSFFSLAHCYLL